MYIDVCAHACVYVHFCNIPPQVLKLASLAPPHPPPHPPPPPPNIEKLPTHMSQAAILGSPFETQNYFTFIPQSKKGCKDQQPLNSSTTFDPGHPIGK